MPSISSFFTPTGRKLFRTTSGSLWETCIGLEIHAQVISNTKLFSRASAQTDFAAIPNSKVAFLDAALPGTLPAINKECVHQSIRTGLALGSTIQRQSMFERKHYFYCDLPQGYQITQQRAPIATGGSIPLPILPPVDETNTPKRGKKSKKSKKNDSSSQNDTQQMALPDQKFKQIRVNRIQIEQDSGKNVHDVDPVNTLVDLNRAGSALMEIVLEPDVRSAEEAGEVVRYLQHLLRHIETCDGNMEEGSMRCDLNVSVRRVGSEMEVERDPRHDDVSTFGERVEVKNMNSIRKLVQAAEYEALRQIEHLETSSEPIQKETRTFDTANGVTKRMRSKESAKDYRFFPDPDLPPLCVDECVIENLKETLPELPDAVMKRLCKTFHLSPYEANVLVQEPKAAAYFEDVARVSSRPSKLVSNWVTNDLFGLLKDARQTIAECSVSPERLGALLDLIVDGTISGKIAKETLPIMFYEDERHPLEIVEEKGWKQITDEVVIEKFCRDVVFEPVMKASGGKVHPEKTNEVLKRILQSEE